MAQLVEFSCFDSELALPQFDQYDFQQKLGSSVKRQVFPHLLEQSSVLGGNSSLTAEESFLLGSNLLLMDCEEEPYLQVRLQSLAYYPI